MSLFNIKKYDYISDKIKLGKLTLVSLSLMKDVKDVYHLL